MGDCSEGKERGNEAETTTPILPVSLSFVRTKRILALVRLRGHAAGIVYWKFCVSIIEMLFWLGNYGVRGSLGCLRLCTCIVVACKRTACIHYLLLYSYHRLSSCVSWRNILVHQRRQWLCQRAIQILRGNEATRGCRATKEDDDGRGSQSHFFIVCL